MIAEPASIGPDNWLHVGDDGTPPRIVPGAASLNFRDVFHGPLNLAWEWPFERRPGMATGPSGLRLRGSARGRTRLDAGIIARRIGTANYTATAVVDRAGLKGAAQGGLASYRNEFEAIGVSLGRNSLTVWQRRFGKFRQLAKVKGPTAKLVQLRMIARGDDFRFQSSTNGKVWKAVGRRSYHGPIEESARPALTAGGARGATARFTSASVSAN
jgi:beta-xylosidase